MKKNKINITYLILFGKPASGKGLHAKIINNFFKNSLYKVGTGDLIRNEIESQTPLGFEINSIVQTGKLVDSAIVKKLIKNNLRIQNTMLDGFPRTRDQAEFILNEISIMEVIHDVKITPIAIMLDIKNDLAISRAMKRKDGREDDNLRTLRTRLDVADKTMNDVAAVFNARNIPINTLDANIDIFADNFESRKKELLDIIINAHQRTNE